MFATYTKKKINMNNSFETLLAIGNLMMFFSSFFLIWKIWKERKNIKDFSPIGSLLTFFGLITFCIGYYIANLYLPLFLAIPTTIFWFIASIFSIKKMWEGNRKLGG
jgi:vacuolar-type H+-ATPase subunit I/STV1